MLVLRNGRLVAEFDSVPAQGELVSAMLGETYSAIQEIAHHEPFVFDGAGPALHVENLSVYVDDRQLRPRVLDVSLDVYPGEIVGLYGLVRRQGRTEMGRALYGAWPGPVSGTVEISGVRGLAGNPRQALKRGLSLLVEDRKSQGVFQGQSVASNMTVAMLDELRRHGSCWWTRRPSGDRVDDFIQTPRRQATTTGHRDRCAERRQPAEDIVRPLAGHQAEGADPRRADLRRRRRGARFDTLSA